MKYLYILEKWHKLPLCPSDFFSVLSVALNAEYELQNLPLFLIFVPCYLSTSNLRMLLLQ